jgi:hypothetical protein
MFGHKSFLRIGILNDSSIMGLYRSSYELEDCHFSFSQGVNTDGKAQTEVRGGTIHLTLANIPTNEILQWMLKSHKFEDGAIIICDENNAPLEKIFFLNATCVSLEINYVQAGKSYVNTKLILQAEKINVGDSNLNNQWKY